VKKPEKLKQLNIAAIPQNLPHQGNIVIFGSLLLGRLFFRNCLNTHKLHHFTPFCTQIQNQLAD